MSRKTIKLDDILGVAEVAALIGKTKNHIPVLTARGTGGFPQPVLRLAAGPLYRRQDVEAWLAGQGVDTSSSASRQHYIDTGHYGDGIEQGWLACRRCDVDSATAS